MLSEDSTPRGCNLHPHWVLDTRPPLSDSFLDGHKDTRNPPESCASTGAAWRWLYTNHLANPGGGLLTSVPGLLRQSPDPRTADRLLHW